MWESIWCSDDSTSSNIETVRLNCVLNAYCICDDLPQHVPAATEKAGLCLCTAASQWRHIKRISLFLENFDHVPSTRISEWLPQLAYFNIFVLAHNNANEHAGVLSHWQNSGRNPAAVVLSVMADVIPLLKVTQGAFRLRATSCDVVLI
jgi:hypothetical protein